jgi:hypothetical protein
MNFNPSQGADALRPVVTQWVGQSFFGTLMKSARGGSLAPENSPFSGGRGGEAFQEMLDGRLAEAAGRGAAEPLVDSIVKRITRPPQPPVAPSNHSRGILA